MMRMDEEAAKEKGGRDGSMKRVEREEADEGGRRRPEREEKVGQQEEEAAATARKEQPRSQASVRVSCCYWILAIGQSGPCGLSRLAHLVQKFQRLGRTSPISPFVCGRRLRLAAGRFDRQPDC